MKFYGPEGKHVPKDIKNYLTPLALAYWFMDDGGVIDFGSSLRISTNSFSEEDVNLLKNCLNDIYGFSFEVVERDGFVLRYYKPTPFLELIEPYVIPSMRFKLKSFTHMKDISPRDHQEAPYRLVSGVMV